MIDRKVSDFIARHRLGVLTTLLPEGMPHSAVLHYAASTSPLYFIFLSDKESRKNQRLLHGGTSLSSLVVGFSEEEWVTLQLEGETKILTKEDELGEGWRTYTEKFIGSDKYRSLSDSVLLKFVPNWWRYTELKPAPAKVIVSSS